VRFVDLAPLLDAARVPSVIAREIGAAPVEDGTALSTIVAFVGDQRMLLVLDNFEHILPAATDVGGLLAACPGLVVLATSREPLHLRWERTLPLGPLPVPDTKHLPSLDRLAQVPAVTLFLERACASNPGFVLAPHNAQAVAELCVRLDGLPLAIELVAARAAQLGPSATLERLARRLPLPPSAMQDAPVTSPVATSPMVCHWRTASAPPRAPPCRSPGRSTTSSGSGMGQGQPVGAGAGPAGERRRARRLAGQYAHVIERTFRMEYEAVFGPLPKLSRVPNQAGPVDDATARGAWEALSDADREAVTRIYVNMGKAIAAYERQLLPGPSRFDA
jgi:hypothetical protein